MSFPLRRILPISTLCVLVLVAVGCASSNPPAAISGSLSDLIAKRLELGKDVAWTKFNFGVPVLDPKREIAVLDQVLVKADNLGVNQQRAKMFFTAQISASREVQIEAIDSWKHGARMPVTKPKSLMDNIRPRIDALDDQILAVLAKDGFSGSHVVDIQAQLTANGFSQIASHLAAEGVAQ